MTYTDIRPLDILDWQGVSRIVVGVVDHHRNLATSPRKTIHTPVLVVVSQWSLNDYLKDQLAHTPAIAGSSDFRGRMTTFCYYGDLDGGRILPGKDVLEDYQPTCKFVEVDTDVLRQREMLEHYRLGDALPEQPDYQIDGRILSVNSSGKPGNCRDGT